MGARPHTVQGMCLTLGSLFDGSGTFPLAATMVGITPLWASEVEPLPIRVTRKNLPNMKHLGDITALDGGVVPPVDIIAGGSPCQNLSLAGNKQGLAGAESGLFFEQIRVITEMREATDGVYPRYAVWENVPGAFRTNNGEDFRQVLSYFARAAAGKRVSIPGPAGGRWGSAGGVLGDGWSLAWRVLDAQYWGVPQRRKRIFLVVDFGGTGGGEVLFDASCGEGDFEAGGVEGAGVAGGVGGGSTGDCRGVGESRLTGGGMADSSPVAGNQDGDDYSLVTDSQMAWFNCSPMTGGGVDGGVADSNPEAGSQMAWFNCSPMTGDYTGPATVSQTLKSLDSRTTRPKVCYGISAMESYAMNSPNPEAGIYETRVHRTLMSGFTSPTSRNGGTVIVDGAPSRVRQVTPLECSRLQGFPDWWISDLTQDDPSGDEVGFWLDVWRGWARVCGTERAYTGAWVRGWLRRAPSDSGLYKMWGNGIALPCAVFVMRGIKNAYVRRATGN